MSHAQPVKIWILRQKLPWILVATAVVLVAITVDAWVKAPSNRPWIVGFSVAILAFSWVVSRTQTTVSADPAVVVATRWLRTKRVVLDEHISVALWNDTAGPCISASGRATKGAQTRGLCSTWATPTAPRPFLRRYSM